MSSQIVTLPSIPELFDPNFLELLVPPKPSSSSDTKQPEPLPSNPMIDALKGTSIRTLTENLAPAYTSTSSPTLDAFQLLNKDLGKPVFDSLLKKAWDEDPQLTLRIIWNLRSIHDGKGDKETFYQAFGWLLHNHPRTAISNLHMLVDQVCTRKTKNEETQDLSHGYWKDLLNILAMASLGELDDPLKRSTFLHPEKNQHVKRKRNVRRPRPESKEAAAANIEASLKRDAEAKASAHSLRAHKAKERHDALTQKLTSDKPFRALYIAVARLITDRLATDLRLAAAFDALPPTATLDDRHRLLTQLSLAGKWAPTPGCAHDRATNIATAVILLLRAAQVPLVYPTGPTADDPAILRSFYQRQVLTRLRAAAAVTEPLMVAQRWKQITYSRVPSVCMRNNASTFYVHDPEGFERYIESVEKGKKTISGATLFPHELVAQAIAIRMGAEGKGKGKKKGKAGFSEARKKLAESQERVVEAQWKTMVGRVREAGVLDNAIAVCDVSGSMGSLDYLPDKTSNTTHVPPILPAISLSLVLASVSKPPWNGGFITFSKNPKYVTLDLEDKKLYDIVSDMRGADWGMNTDLQAVFLKLILPLAVKDGVKQEDMIKRLFIFSDMQFDACRGHGVAGEWSTNYDEIEKAYKDAGYEVPQIVYWDLAACKRTVETDAERKGVAMMNGFSAAMMKVFMEGDKNDEEKMEVVEVEVEEQWEAVEKDGETTRVEERVKEEEFTPVGVMKKAVGKKSYDGLVVFD